jgi:hypothetical protein
MNRIETIAEGVTLHLGDCRDFIGSLSKAGAVVSDPPYPNGAGHFLEGIEAAEQFLAKYSCDHWMVFWDELERPPVPLPLSAVHVWHRTNTNRPDNYEPIYEFRKDGQKRASRVLPYCVIFPGLTGVEASGHPTEKNVDLMTALIRSTKGLIVDPFMGSGTTGVAAVKLGREFIGIELNSNYFDIACRRIEKASKQIDMFISAPKPKQEALF